MSKEFSLIYPRYGAAINCDLANEMKDFVQ